MRRVLAALLLLTLSGCVTPEPAPPATNTTPTTTPDVATYPAKIEDSKPVQGGADPTAEVRGPCSAPSAKCSRYPFTMNASGHVLATLTWGTPTNDFDLFLLLDGAIVESDAAQPPGTQAKIDADVEAGEYELVVDPYAVPQDTFKIVAEFGPATG